MKFSIETLCRLNGAEPTPRERWTAFHRLWRMARDGSVHRDHDACDCFRILFPDDVAFILLLNADDKEVGRSHWPLFLRKRRLESERRRRLHGEFGEWLERDRRVAATLHGRGTEVTPDKVAEVRQKVIRHVRQRAAEDGIRVPASDVELMEWLRSK